MLCILHSRLFLFQIPTSIYHANIVLVVKSKYNFTLESTLLKFQVCNNFADDCASITSSVFTTASSVNTGTNPNSNGLTQSVIIVIAVLGGVVAIALLLVGFLCWKRKQNSSLSKERAAGRYYRNKPCSYCFYN